MEFRRHKIELNFHSNGYLWIPHLSIRGKQDFVHRKRVEEFMAAYLNNEPIPPPHLFLDSERDIYIIDEGHTRSIALFILARNGVMEVGNNNYLQSIVGGFTIREITLSAHTHSYKNIYTLDEIEILDE